MEVTNPGIQAISTISGVAACYWLGFTCCWTCAYINARQESSPMRGGTAFYLSAFLYQVTAVAYFASYCLCTAVNSKATVLIWYVCSTLYIPQTYLMGMSCSLGFGTLFTTVSGVRVGILVGVWTVATVTCVLGSLVDIHTAMILNEVLFVLFLVLQVGIFIHTVLLFKRLFRAYSRRGYYNAAIIVHKSLRHFRFIAVIFTFQFCILAVESTLQTHSLIHGSKEVAIWAVFVMTTAVVNSWALLLMNPNEAMSDMEKLLQEVRLDFDFAN